MRMLCTQTKLLINLEKNSSFCAGSSRPLAACLRAESSLLCVSKSFAPKAQRGRLQGRGPEAKANPEVTFEGGVLNLLLDLGRLHHVSCHPGQDKQSLSGLEAVPVVFHHWRDILETSTRDKRLETRGS